MNRFRIVILLTLLFSIQLSANNDSKKNILLIHSYHPGMTWVKNINNAVEETLDIQKNEYVLFTEYMDTKRHNSKSYYKQLKEIYKEKYRNKHIDIILSTDNNAFNFLVQNRDQLFGDTPVVFSGVNGFEGKLLENTTNFTGAAEQFSAKETIDQILKFNPDTKQIYIINDYLETGQAWKKDIKKALKGYEDKIKLIYSENLTLEDLKNKIESFDSDTAILMGVYFADKDKNYITYEKVGTYLLGSSRAPVYCLLNFNISNNVIGGKVISGYTQGKMMSKIALKVLNGADINNIPVTYSEANEFIFNYYGINKYNLDESLLPKNSTIINKPYSIYEDYKIILFTMIAIFGVSFLILLIFLIYYKFQKNSNKTINKEALLLNFIRFGPIIVIPIITISVIWILIYNANKNFEDMRTYEKKLYVEQKKSEAKREVDRFVEIAQTRLSINNYTDINKIKNNLLSIASNIKYDVSGYLMINSIEGKMISHPNKKLLNKDLFNGKNEHAKEVFLKFKDVVDRQGSGFVTYQWNNPTSKSIENKITYVRELPELGWYVAAGVYIDELDKYMEKKENQNKKYENRSLLIISTSSILLLLITIFVSIGLSIFIRKIFRQYKNSIIDSIKQKDALEATKKEFEKLARTDDLTRVQSRYSIMSILQHQLNISKEKNSSFSVLMFDLDHFKNVNDKYGHDVGDYVLKQVCQIAQNHLRDDDEIGRYGGEEFIVTLPNTGLKTAKMIAERLRHEVEIFKFDLVGSITISIGVIETSKTENELELFKRLDILLYNSKDQGRNRVSA